MKLKSKSKKRYNIKNRILRGIALLAAYMILCLSFMSVYAESTATPEPTATDSYMSGTTRGSYSTPKPSATAKPSATPSSDETDSDNDNDEDNNEETEASPTADPRVNEDGTPNMAENETAVLINSLNGEIMYEQNAYKRVYPASTTKIMTALLTLEAIDRGEVNLNSSFLIMPEMLEGLAADGSSMLLKEGEALTVNDLLKGLLIQSGNDAAQALAIIVCGDIDTFVERMNNKAAELGMSDTHFTNVHGLHDDDHYTTAADLATLTLEAMKNNTFRELVASTQVKIPATALTGDRTFINTNGLLSTLRYSNYYYEYAIGVKTGHTSQAGYCLVSAAKKGDLEVIGVVMNAETEDDKHYDSRNLLAYAIDNFKVVTAITRGDMVSEIRVKFGSGSDHTTLSVTDDIRVTIPQDANVEDLSIEPRLAEYAVAPVEQGEVMGTVDIVLDGEVVGSGELTADFAVKRHPLGFLMQFFSFLWSFTAVKVIVCALLIFIVIFAAYMIINIRKNIKIAEKRRRTSRRKRG